MLSPRLLTALRTHWRFYHRKSSTWLFPSNYRKDRPIDTKTVWYACHKAAQRAGLQKRVHPHTLRHCQWVRSALSSLELSMTSRSYVPGKVMCRELRSISKRHRLSTLKTSGESDLGAALQCGSRIETAREPTTQPLLLSVPVMIPMSCLYFISCSFGGAKRLGGHSEVAVM